MKWLIRFLSSSIGLKLVMSLTGLFLISFLIVHLAGNLQLLSLNGEQSFNVYSQFMTNNPVIKTISFGLYFFLILHSVQGLVIWIQNRIARGSQSYSITKSVGASGTNPSSSRNMAYFGLLILAFLFIHMGDFWWAARIQDKLPFVEYDGVSYNNLHLKVHASFKEPWIVISYLVGMIALFFHLRHGFWSAFQTLGINHPKYTSFLRMTGGIFAFVISFLFAIIPVYVYFYYPDIIYPDMGGLIN